MVRTGNLIRVAPLAQLQKERELQLAQQKQEYELTPLETRLIPVSYAQADELQARAKDLLSPRGSIAVDERTNVLIARDIDGNLNYIEELIRSLDTQTAAGAHRGAHRRGHEQLHPRRRHPVGRRLDLQPGHRQPDGRRVPVERRPSSGGNYDNNTPTAGLSPFTRNGRRARTSRSTSRPPSAPEHGGALGLSLGSIDNTFNLGLRLSAAETERACVRIVSRPRILDAGQPRGAHQPGHADSVLAGQRARRSDDLPGSQAAAAREAARHRRRHRRDAREDQPRRAELQPDGGQRRAHHPEARGRDRPARDGRPHGGHRRHLHAQHRPQPELQVPFFGDIPILGILFQRRTASDTRNELVIFITPRIVNRAEALGR